MYKHGQCRTLLQLLEHFTMFAQEGQEAWEVINERPNSFFGTTFKARGITDGSFVYISIRHQNVIQNFTYNDWFQKGYLCEDREKDGYDYRKEITISTTSKFGRADIFNESGSFLGFNVHNQYDEGLWMCEQGGSFNPAKGSLGLLSLRQLKTPKGSTTYETFIEAPIFPDIGRPLLTLSNTNSSLGIIEYWFYKGRNNATIVMKVDKYFQTISFGLLDGVDYKTYRFPAYISGGTTGLRNSGWVYTPLYGGNPTNRRGLVITLDIKSTVLSNSNILTSTKMVNSSISNTIVKTADGSWEIYNNYLQDFETKPYHVCNDIVRNWGFPLKQPQKVIGGQNSIFPSDTEFIKLIDFEDVIASYNEYMTPLLIPVTLMRNNQKLKGVTGFIPKHYALFSKKISDGIVKINGNTYLVLPNGWNDRLYYYPNYLGVYTLWENNELLDSFNDMKLNEFCRLAIKLEV